MDVYLPHYHVPMRVSTPTCAGSKSSVSMFQCPHDCFVDKEAEETILEQEEDGDTIEEMEGEEGDVDSIRQLVNRGLDTGTDCLTDRWEAAHPRPQTGLTQKSVLKHVVSYKSCMKAGTLKL